jgi:hypothetical protein
VIIAVCTLWIITRVLVALYAYFVTVGRLLNCHGDSWHMAPVSGAADCIYGIYAFHKAEAKAAAAAEAKAAAAQAKAAAAAEAKAAAAQAKAAAAAQDKAAAADKAALASQQCVMQVVGATVTSAIGYGLYWISTQGD